jgi:hypothetical protein
MAKEPLIPFTQLFWRSSVIFSVGSG